MLEQSLVAMAKHLKSVLEVDILYTDKDSIFRKLSESNMPLDLPIASYYESDLELYNINTRTKRRTSLRASVTNNHIKTIDIVPISVSINVALVTKTLKDRIKLAKSYFKLQNLGSYLVSFNINGDNVEFDLPILDIKGLQSPIEGKDGHDYDKGTYYVYEGTFKIVSAFLYTDNVPLIRETLSTISTETING